MAWDIYTEDFADLTDWTDGDVNDGVSEISPAGELHQKNTLTTGIGWLTQDIGTIGSGDYTFEIKFKFDVVPAAYYSDMLDIDAGTNKIRLAFHEGAVQCYTGAAYTNLFAYTWVADTWYVIRGIIHESQTDIDTYLDGVSKSTNIACAYSTGTDGMVTIGANAFAAVAGCEWSIDYLYIGAGQQVPSTTSIKKVSGVAYASIKKIGGVAIGSVKKIGGVE